MSNLLPNGLVRLIDSFGALPGVGPRTAERFAYWCLKHDQKSSQDLAAALLELHDSVKICPRTFALINSSDDISPLYSDPSRDKRQIAVVAEPYDIVAIEKTSSYHGTYHVLGGLISPIDGIGPEQLHMQELLRRIPEDAVQEVILATNASVEGEATALYIQQQVSETAVKVTRLARGLPIGVDLEYADQITLTRAFEGRTEI